MLGRILPPTLVMGVLFLVAILPAGCGPPASQLPVGEEEKLKVVASISILADLAQQVVGERGRVEYIVPRGQNPEDYELGPREMEKISKANLFLINGLGLEGSMEKVFDNLAVTTPIVELTSGIEVIPLQGDRAPDPHAWLDPRRILTYVDNIVAALEEVDPDGEKEYRKNAEEFKEQVLELDRWIWEQVESIPESQRLIVISENAFKYFGAAYGFETEGIWELNSHEEGTPQQLARIIDVINSRKLAAVFVETTLDPRYMENISRETGVPIAGQVYTDALGLPGSGAETYLDMMRHNVGIFVEGLGQKHSPSAGDQ